MYTKHVSAIMSPKVVVANLDHTFTQVRSFFATHKLHHLPVMDGDMLIGIISTNDMMKAYNHYLEELGTLHKDTINNRIKVEDIMTKNPVTVTSTDNVQKAVELMNNNNFHALPVVDNGQVVGIVTSNDLVRYLHHVMQAELQGN